MLYPIQILCCIPSNCSALMQGKVSLNQRFYLYFRVENNSGNYFEFSISYHSMEQSYRKWSRLNGIVFVRADSNQKEGYGSGISQTPNSSNFCQYLEAIFHYRCNLGGDFYVRSSSSQKKERLINHFLLSVLINKLNLFFSFNYTRLK